MVSSNQKAVTIFGLVVCGAACSAASAAGAQLHKSGPIKITVDGQYVWVVNPDHDAVSRLRTVDNHVDVFQLPGGPHNPTGIDVTADGAVVWVAALDSDTIFALDGSSGAVLSTIPLDHGVGPVHLTLSPAEDRLVVALHRAGVIVVIDPTTSTIVGQIEGLFRRPFGLSFTSSPDELWVGHSVTDGEDSHVTALDLASMVVKARVVLKSVNPKEVGHFPNPGAAHAIPEGGYLLQRGHLAEPPGAGHLWMPVQYQNFHNDVYTPDSTVQAAIHKIDLASGNHLTDTSSRILLTAVYAHNNTTLLGDGWDAGISGPEDLAFSADGQTAYLVNAYSNDVIVFDTSIDMVKTGPPLTEINVGDNPLGIVASPTSDTLYVMNYLSRDVSVIDTVSLTETTRVSVTPGVPEPRTPGDLLGAKVFNSSSDPRASINGKVSCASCHIHDGSDALSWDFGVLGAGSRKTLRMQGLSLSFAPGSGGMGQLHRSGDRDEVQDFEHTFRGPLMGGTGFLALPNPSLGLSNAGIDADLDAMAAYILALPPLARSPHRLADGSLDKAAIRGAELFKNNSGSAVDVGCNDCHPAPAYADLDFHDVGGHVGGTEFEGPAFNTPSLVGAWDDAPYIQTVSWADGFTLGGLVRTAQYPTSGAEDHGDTSGLTRIQRRDLEAFLLSLDGDLATAGIAAVVDTDPPVVRAIRPVSLDVVVVIFDETVDGATASDPANYILTDGQTHFIPSSATLDLEWGNRVKLDVALDYTGCPTTYTLLPGPIEDVAGSVGSGANNVLDALDPANQANFLLDGTITVTFGDSGHETFSSVTTDAGIVAGLTNWSHARWVLSPGTNPPMKGFIKFDFAPLLSTECGVSDSADIVDARFTNQPEQGYLGTIDLRRCLKPWGEPPNDWCNNCASAVTVNHARRTGPLGPAVSWATSGARNYGGSGTSTADYWPNSSFDLSAVVDGSIAMGAINVPTEFTGAAVSEAFRFWFDNPSYNFGFAAELNGDQFAMFHGNDTEGGEFGAVLSITYSIDPNATGCLYGDVNQDGVVDLDDVLCVVDAFQGDFAQCTFEAADIAPCAQDGLVNLSDIVAVMDAFAGIAACP